MPSFKTVKLETGGMVYPHQVVFPREPCERARDKLLDVPATNQVALTAKSYLLSILRMQREVVDTPPNLNRILTGQFLTTMLNVDAWEVELGDTFPNDANVRGLHRWP